jgi:hypothetical protein
MPVNTRSPPNAAAMSEEPAKLLPRKATDGIRGSAANKGSTEAI